MSSWLSRESFATGQRVRAQDAYGRWRSARITLCRTEGSFDLVYDDNGVAAHQVPLTQLRGEPAFPAFDAGATLDAWGGGSGAGAGGGGGGVGQLQRMCPSGPTAFEMSTMSFIESINFVNASTSTPKPFESPSSLDSRLSSLPDDDAEATRRANKRAGASAILFSPMT